MPAREKKEPVAPESHGDLTARPDHERVLSIDDLSCSDCGVTGALARGVSAPCQRAHRPNDQNSGSDSVRNHSVAALA